MQPRVYLDVNLISPHFLNLVQSLGIYEVDVMFQMEESKAGVVRSAASFWHIFTQVKCALTLWCLAQQGNIH
jgi:hypothetical protein